MPVSNQKSVSFNDMVSRSPSTPRAPALSPAVASSTVASSSVGAPPRWVINWMVITTVIVTWDAAFGLLSPLSRDESHWFFSVLFRPYQQKYQHLDMFYAKDEVFASVVGGHNAFGPSQTAMNVAEVAVQLVFLYLALRAKSSYASVVGLCVSVATFSKTVLYFVMLYNYGWQKMLVGTTQDRILLFLIPNGIWSAYLAKRPAGRQGSHARSN